MASKTDFNGKTTSYTYDAANRLTAKVPDASFNDTGVAFTYSATGKRLTMTDASGQTAYAYDGRDRLVEKAGPVGTLRYRLQRDRSLEKKRLRRAGGGW